MIDRNTLEQISRLARLHVSEDEARAFSEQLTKALGYFEQISAVETEGVEPLVTPTEMVSHWREDEEKKELSAEEIVAGAPARTGNLFTVPPVV